MAVDWKLLERHNGIHRAGNTGKGDPTAFTIVGVDATFDDIAARIPDGDDRSLAILRYGCKDADRLRDGLDDEWVDAFDLTGKTDPIHFWQLIDRDGKSIAIVTDGRSRCCALRIVNDRRKTQKQPTVKLEAMPDPFLSKNAGEIALRMKRLRNRSIPDSLSTLAEAAGEWLDLGRDVTGVATEMGINVEKAAVLIKWAGIFPRLCDEARKRANDGKMPIGAAVRLVNKYPTKAEQAEHLSGEKKPTKKKEARPLSPRTLSIFAEQAAGDSSVPAGFVALLRLMTGDRTAIDKLPPSMRAAWLRTEEAAKQKARKAE